MRRGTTDTLLALREHRQVEPADLVFELGITERSVRRRLNALMEDGLVASFEHATVVYSLSDEGRDLADGIAVTF